MGQVPPPGAQREDNLSFLTFGQIEWNLDRPTGIQAGSHSAGKPRACHRCRTRKRSVAAEELHPIAAHRADGLAGIEKGHAAAKLRVVRVPREKRAAARVHFGNHVHQRFRP